MGTTKTLAEHLPIEFIRGHYEHTRAYKFRDVDVIAKHDTRKNRWPGRRRNVKYWFVLASGHIIGWNETPRGWSFEVIGINLTVSR